MSITMPNKITVPPSKSLSHRSVIAAALAPGISRIDNVLESDDISRTIGCLNHLGAKIKLDNKTLSVQGMDLNSPTEQKRSDPVSLNVGESGTTSRLITAVASLTAGQYNIFGQGRMHERPLGELVKALEQLGASFVWLSNPGYLPCILESKGLEGGHVQISLEQSSQFVSALLLASPLARSDITITVARGPISSWPYVLLTLQVMETFGCPVKISIYDQGSWQSIHWRQLTSTAPEAIRFFMEPSQYQATTTTIEGDWSNASYFLAAGAILSPGLTISGLDPESRQGDRAILDILTRMGAKPDWDNKGLTIFPRPLTGADFDMGNCPDLVPTVAVLASLAQGTTRITNVAHLRLKESDRLGSLATEIEKTGSKVFLRTDGLEIMPGSLIRDRTIYFQVYNDHRMAMSLAIYGLAGLKIQLDTPECVSKSFPNFWEIWDQLKK